MSVTYKNAAVRFNPSWTHAVDTITLVNVEMTGKNRNAYPFVGMRFSGSSFPNFVTRGNDSYALQASVTQGSAKAAVWASTNEPQTTTANMVFSKPTADGTWGVGYIAVSDSNQESRIAGAHILNSDKSGSGGLIPLSVPSEAGALVMDLVVLIGNPSSIGSPGPGQTERAAFGAGTNSIHCKCSTKPGETFATMSWSIDAGTGDMVHYAWSVNGVSATTPSPPRITAEAFSPEALRVNIATVDNGGAEIINTLVEWRASMMGGEWSRESIKDEVKVYYLRHCAPGTRYDVRVIQENSEGESEPSNVETLATPQPADQEDLTLMAWGSRKFSALPLYGDGTFTLADYYVMVGLPIPSAATLPDFDFVIPAEVLLGISSDHVMSGAGMTGVIRDAGLPTDGLSGIVRQVMLPVEWRLPVRQDTGFPVEALKRLVVEAAIPVEAHKALVEIFADGAISVEGLAPVSMECTMQINGEVSVALEQTVPVEWLQKSCVDIFFPVLTVHFVEAFLPIPVEGLAGKDEGELPGKYKIEGMPYLMAASSGLLPGTRLLSIFGHNPNIDGPEEDIWDFGGSYPFLTAPSLLRLVSTCDSDEAVGEGARTVRVTGLDRNYALQSETISLKGTTPVGTNFSYIRLHSVVVLTAGETGQTHGNLTITAVTGGHTLGFIQAGHNETRLSQYTVPSGKTGYIVNLYANQFATQVRTATIKFQIRPFGGAFLTLQEGRIAGGHVNFPDLFQKIPEKSDVLLRASSDEPHTVVSGGYRVLLLDN